MPNAPSNPFVTREPTVDEERARVDQQYVYARTEMLLQLAEFCWFQKECIQARHDQAQKDALDTTKTPEERDRAAHVRQAIEEILTWLPKMRNASRTAIKD